MSTNPDHINQLAAILREVDGSHGKGAADLAEAILGHPGMWQPPAALAQPEGQSMLNVNLKLDTSPECLKRLVDGLTKAVTPNGGYEAATTDDPAPGTGGDQMVQVQWWIPQHGCDSLENTLDAIKYKITCAVTDWFATAMVPAGSEQPEGEGLTNDEALRRGRSAIEAAPKSRNPTMDEVMDLARSFQLEVSDRDAGALMWLVITAIAVWGDASATPPAPEAGELGEVVEWLESQAAHLRKMQEIGALPETELQEMLDRAATLLQQQEARIAALRSALADCGRAVRAFIADDCSDDFLLQVPAEVRLAAAKPAPAVVPVAVSERLPTMEAGDFDRKGRCWWGDPGGEQFVPSWRLCELVILLPFTHWLPAHAIPLPQAGKVKS